MYPLKIATAITIPFFAHDVNGDAVTGLVDGDFTKRISKNGAAFGAMTVTITEMENGWYSLPVGTGHSDTLGVLSMTFTSATIKQVNLQFRVHARINDDLAWPTTTGRSLDVSATGEAGLDFNNIKDATGATTLTNITVPTVTTNTDMRGTDGANTVTPDASGTAAGLHATTDALVNGLNDLSAANVNAEMVDVLSTDTQTLPGQGAPTVTPTIEEAIMYLYKQLRNKETQTATTYKLFADDGTTIDQQATLSDDETTFTKAEMVSG